MPPPNIETFNIVVAHIFDLLYEEFPELASIGQDHFTSILDSEGNVLGRDSNWLQIHSAIVWLEHEGFIRAKGYTSSGCHGAVLTLKGFNALQSVPSSVAGEGSLGDRIKTALAAGSKSAVSKLVDQLLETGMKLAIGAT